MRETAWKLGQGNSRDRHLGRRPLRTHATEMCGICGIWGEAASESLEAMVQAMNHRGPDDHGTYRDDLVALGMTRLAIIDLSAAALQPMSNPQGSIWIVYNGEVYNFLEERRLLEGKGYSFSSSSDTEVVLRMYEYYGDDFLLRLRGMFALAIYDKRRGHKRARLLLARDHLGIKPLLYAILGDKLVFASELKAILASGLVPGEIDPVALRLLLTFGSVYQPRTMIREVKMLPPAHRLIIEKGRHHLERYWSLGLNRRPELKTLPYDQAVVELSRVVEDSVRQHLVSDVPVGAFLSGGVDSSLLVAMMARSAGGRVKTFSVGFEAEGIRYRRKWRCASHGRIPWHGSYSCTGPWHRCERPNSPYLKSLRSAVRRRCQFLFRVSCR